MNAAIKTTFAVLSISFFILSAQKEVMVITFYIANDKL